MKKIKKKTLYRDNQKYLSSHTWTPDVQYLNVP